MKFKILSRENARKYSYQQDIEDCIIISISDVEKLPNMFCRNEHIIDVLFLYFDDVDFGDPNCITKDDGRRIIEFVNNYIDEVKTIIVHCEAGVSRSAGVCAALMKIINGDDWEVFNNSYFCPNMSCYRTVLETYCGSYDEKEADQKIKHNIEIWKKRNDVE